MAYRLIQYPFSAQHTPTTPHPTTLTLHPSTPRHTPRHQTTLHPPHHQTTEVSHFVGAVTAEARAGKAGTQDVAAWQPGLQQQ